MKKRTIVATVAVLLVLLFVTAVVILWQSWRAIPIDMHGRTPAAVALASMSMPTSDLSVVRQVAPVRNTRGIVEAYSVSISTPSGANSWQVEVRKRYVDAWTLDFEYHTEHGASNKPSHHTVDSRADASANGW